MERKIIHIDMDAFYASVEQLDNPLLRGQPIAVGGSEARGVVSAASYEARKYGVHSAMSGYLAKKKCPHIIFVPLRFNRYKEISKMVKSVFYEYTDLVEPLSLDEAYLDVTQNKKGNPSATLIAQEIRKKVYEKTGLTCSAGVSYNKFLAKVGSDINKPNGIKTIAPYEALMFLEQLDIKKFYGIGKVTTEKMYQLGIFTGKELKNQSLEFLTQHFGKQGAFYYNIVRGIHNSEVKPHRESKSVGAERTFEYNISSEVFLFEKIEKIAKEVSKRLQKSNLSGKTITLKIKYSDFKLQTRSTTLPYFVKDAAVINDTAKSLLFKEKLSNSVRLVGLQVSNLNNHQKKQVAVQLKFDF